MLSPGRHRRRRENEARRAKLTPEERHAEDLEWEKSNRQSLLALLGLGVVVLFFAWLSQWRANHP